MPTYNLDEFTLDQLQQNEVEAYNNKDQQALQRWQQLKQDKQERLNFLATQRENDTSWMDTPGLGTALRVGNAYVDLAKGAQSAIGLGFMDSTTDFIGNTLSRIPRASAQVGGQFAQGLQAFPEIAFAKLGMGQAQEGAVEQSNFDPTTYPIEQIDQRAQQDYAQRAAGLQASGQELSRFMDRNTLPNNTPADSWINAIAQAPANVAMSAASSLLGPFGQAIYLGARGLAQARDTLRRAGLQDKDMPVAELVALTSWNAATERLGDVGAGLGSKLSGKGANLLQKQLGNTPFGKLITDYISGTIGGSVRRGIIQGGSSEFMDSALQDLASHATILSKTQDMSFGEAVLKLATNPAWISENSTGWFQEAAAGAVGGFGSAKIEQALTKKPSETPPPPPEETPEDVPFDGGPPSLPFPTPPAGLLSPPNDPTAPLAGERESITGEPIPPKPAKFRAGFDRVRTVFQDSLIPLDYYNTVTYLESGGDPKAKNKQPGQTAGGLGGITIGTWNDTIKSAGLDPKDLKRDNPQDQALVLRLLTEQNEEALKKFNKLKNIGAGGDYTPANYQRYLAHHFGVGGAMEIMNAASGRSVRGDANPVLIGEIIGENAVSKNPWLAPNGKQLTAKQVVEIIANKFSANPENLNFGAQFPRVWNKERVGSVYPEGYNRTDDLTRAERMLQNLELISRPAEQPQEFVPETFGGITPEVATETPAQPQLATDIVPTTQAKPPFIGEATLPAQQKLQEQIQLVQAQRARETQTQTAGTQPVPVSTTPAGAISIPQAPVQSAPNISGTVAPASSTPTPPPPTRAQRRLAKATAPAKAQVAKFEEIAQNDTVIEAPQVQPEVVEAPSAPTSENITAAPAEEIQTKTPTTKTPTPKRTRTRTPKPKGIMLGPDQQTPDAEFDFGLINRDQSAEVAQVPGRMRDIIVWHGGKNFARPSREGMLRSLGGGAGDYWQGAGFYGSDLEKIGRYYKGLNDGKGKETEILPQADDFSATFDGFDSVEITDELRNIAHTEALSSWPEYKATWEDIENVFDILRTDKNIKNYLIENPHLTDEFILNDARSRLIRTVERAINSGLNNYPSDFYHYYFSYIPIDLVNATLDDKNLPSMAKSFLLRKKVSSSEPKTALHKFNWDIKQQELMRLDKKFEDQSEFVQNAILDELSPAEIDSLFAPITSTYSDTSSYGGIEKRILENIFEDEQQFLDIFGVNFKKNYGRFLTEAEREFLRSIFPDFRNSMRNFVYGTLLPNFKTKFIHLAKEPGLRDNFYQMFYPAYTPAKEWQKRKLAKLSGMTLYEKLGVHHGARAAINNQKSDSDHEPWIAASNLLYNTGIRGNQYPTKYDWNKSDPDKNYNYVIFNPDELEPISKSYDAYAQAKSMLLKNKTEPTAEQIDALQDQLQSILNRLAPGVKATPARSLTENNPMQTEYGMDGLPKFISFATSLVDNPAEASNYLYHEVVHAIFPKLSPNEQSALLERARRKWREKYNIDSRYANKELTQSEFEEEAIAEAMRDYAVNKVATEKPIRTIFDRILNAFRNFGKWLKRAGWALSDSKSKSTFDKILEGEIGRRPYPSEALAAIGEEAGLRAEQTGQQQWIEQNLENGEYTFSNAYRKNSKTALIGQAFGYGEPVQWQEGFAPDSEAAVSRSMQILFSNKATEETKDLAEKFRQKLFSGVDPLASLGTEKRNTLLDKIYYPMQGEKTALNNRLLKIERRVKTIKPTAADLAQVHNFVSERAPASTITNPELRSVAQDLRNIMDKEITPRAVQQKIVNEDTATANLGSYMHRYYPFLTEVNKQLASGQYGNTGSRIANELLRASPLNESKKRKLGDSPEDQMTRQIYGEKTDDPIGQMLYTIALVGHDVIQLEYAGRMLGLAGDAIWKDGNINLPGLGEVSFSRLQAMVEQWNHDKAKGILNPTQEQKLTEYTKILAENPKLAPPSELRSQYQQVPSTKRYGDLGGMWVRNEIAPFILGTQELKSELGKTIEEGVKIWKFKSVVLNFYSYMRNMTSAMMGGWTWAGTPIKKLAWMNPFSEVAENFGHLFNNAVSSKRSDLPGWMEDLVNSGIGTGTYAESELKDLFSSIHGTEGNESLITKAFRKIAGSHATKTAAQIADQLAMVYGLIDTAYKITIAKDLMDRGTPKQEAVRIAQDAIFDYSNVSEGFNRLRKTVPAGSPFITYGVKSLDFVYRAAMNKTGVPGARQRLALSATVPIALSLLAAANLGVLGDSDDDKKNDYLQIRENLYPNYRYNPLTMLFPMISKQSPGFQFMDMSAASPLGPLAQLGSSVASAVQERSVGKVAEGLFSAAQDFGVLTGPLFDMYDWLRHGLDSSTGKPINPPGTSPEMGFRNNLIYGLNHFILPPMLSIPNPERNQPGGAAFKHADAIQNQLAFLSNHLLGTEFDENALTTPGILNPISGTRKVPPAATIWSYSLGGTPLKVNPDETQKYEMLELRKTQKDITSQLYRLKFLETRTGIDPSSVEQQRQFLYSELKKVRDKINSKTLKNIPEEKYTKPKQ
jgi:hypothetical protein